MNLLNQNQTHFFHVIKQKIILMFGLFRNKKYTPLIVDFNNRKPRQLFREKQVCQNGSIFIFKNDIILKNNNRLGW